MTYAAARRCTLGSCMGRAEDLFALITDRGEPAIDEFIAEWQSEELFLDFKRSASNGAGRRLTDHDRDNLGRAISGFGNSEGGLIVWGVDCRTDERKGDVALGKFPLQKPRRFKSWLENAVSGLTIPAHPNVRHATLSGDNAAEGFVVTCIAKSHLAPHQCIRPPQYYMRAGSNFMPVPHAVLAGMFGRRPHPVIFHMWQALPAVLLQNGTARLDRKSTRLNSSHRWISYPVFCLERYFSTFVVRVHGRAEDQLAALRTTVRSVDPQVPVFGLISMEQRLDEVFALPPS